MVPSSPGCWPSGTGTSPEAAGLFRARPPVKPVPLAAIAGLPRPRRSGSAAGGGSPVNGRSGVADVVVVGGGIVGAACAYYLARAGLRVRVLERHFFASGTSRACDGLVLCWDKLSPAELELAKASAALWAGLVDELPQDFEYRRHGSIVLAETGEGLAGPPTERRRNWAGRAFVRKSCDAAGLRALEPNLAHDLPGRRVLSRRRAAGRPTARHWPCSRARRIAAPNSGRVSK